MLQIDQQNAVAGACFGEEAAGLTRDFGQTFARRLNDQGRRRDKIGNDLGDCRKAS
jgi:hypothetical protein